MKTLIIGLGNPILGDDGVGWKIAQEVERQFASPPSLTLPPFSAKFSRKWGETEGSTKNGGSVSVECFALAGISLMEQMIGYERVILIDSLNTGQHAQGEVVTFRLSDLADLTYGHSASAHDLSLKNALKMGRSMGASLPDDENVLIVAVEAAHVYDFTEELSPEIAGAIPRAVKEVFNFLKTN